MIPMLIQQGYVAIAVVFDVWGMAGLVNDGVKKARAFVEGGEDSENKDGEKSEVVNGKPPSS